MSRTYQETHPWITFRADLRRAGPRLWILIGEARSKIEHIAGVPLSPETAEELHTVYLVKGVQGTTAIEGNTLTENQVRQVLEDRLQLPASQEYLEREVQNILGALNRITSRIGSGEEVKLTPTLAGEFNGQVLDGLELEEGVVAGEIRTTSVGVLGYRGAPAEDCEFLLEKLCSWLNGQDFAPRPDLGLGVDLIKAILAHLYLAWIHPFGDGNGRTARLVEFLILVGSGVPTPAAHLLSNHYNQTRSGYYRQLDHASASGGDVLLFIEYALQGLVDGLREQIETIRFHQWGLEWRSLVDGTLGTTPSPSVLRRKQLVLDLSTQSAPVAKAAISSLTPQLAAAYATRTTKTLTRDLNALIKEGFVELTPAGYRARMEMILAFLPVRSGSA